MKHLFIYMIALGLCSPAIAQDDNGAYDDHLIEQRTEYRSGTTTDFHFDLGLNPILDDGQLVDDTELYATKLLGSRTINMYMQHRSHIAGPVFINWGYGINWQHFKFEEPGIRLSKVGPDLLFTDANTAEIAGVKSKLRAAYLKVHAVPTLDLGRKERISTRLDFGRWSDEIDFSRDRRRGWRIGVGPYAGYRIGGQTKVVYKNLGDRQKEKEKGNYYLSNIKYGVRLLVGVNGLNFFADYDLNTLFEGNMPDLNTLTVGITL